MLNVLVPLTLNAMTYKVRDQLFASSQHTPIWKSVLSAIETEMIRAWILY